MQGLKNDVPLSASEADVECCVAQSLDATPGTHGSTTNDTKQHNKVIGVPTRVTKVGQHGDDVHICSRCYEEGEDSELRW